MTLLLNESVALAKIGASSQADNLGQLLETINELKAMNKKLTSALQYILNKEETLEGDYFSPLISTVKFNNNKIQNVYEKADYLAITATLDPRRFTNISAVSTENQKNYFKKIFSQLYIDNELDNIYGCFELQLNGNVHFHGLTRKYNTNHNINNLKTSINRYLTFNPSNKFTTIIKPVTNIAGWLEYINDETKPGDIGHEKEYLEINI